MTEIKGKRVSARQLATRTIKELEEEVAYFKENVPLLLKENEKLKCQVQQFESIGTIEEFKAYKQGDCMNNCEHYDNCANYIYSKGYNQGTIDRAEELQKCREYGYNKAIDEFTEKVCQNGAIADFMKEYIKEIAEQLKGEQHG